MPCGIDDELAGAVVARLRWTRWNIRRSRHIFRGLFTCLSARRAGTDDGKADSAPYTPGAATAGHRSGGCTSPRRKAAGVLSSSAVDHARPRGHAMQVAKMALHRLVPRSRAVVLVAALVMAGLLAGPSLAARAAPPGTGTALTCFATDVSGSNLVASDGEPPSDPGPVFVRQQVVELYDEVLADLGEASGQQVGVVTFGTGIGTELGPIAVSDSAARSRLEAALPGALRPSQAEAAWTSWAAGVDGCSRMFQRSGVTRGMVVVLTDGYPEGPAGGPAQQLAAIAPMAHTLWANGIAIQPLLYGAGAGMQGPARQAMTQLATLGHGQLVLAATPLDMLRGALYLASLATGLPMGGAEVPVNGSSSVPLDLPARVARAVLVVLRSSDKVEVSIAAPDGTTLSSLAAGTGGPGLVIGLSRPAAGTYQASAQGRGSMFAAELVRYDAVTVTPPGRKSGSLGGIRRVEGAPGWSLAWELGLGLVALAAAAVSGRVAASRRRPKGALIVWLGSRWRCLDPVDLDEPMAIGDLFDSGADAAGWFVRWNRRAPVLIGPSAPAMRLVAGQTETIGTAPPATFTWLPAGIDMSLSGEPPGRPIASAGEPLPNADRK